MQSRPHFGNNLIQRCHPPTIFGESLQQIERCRGELQDPVEAERTTCDVLHQALERGPVVRPPLLLSLTSFPSPTVASPRAISSSSLETFAGPRNAHLEQQQPWTRERRSQFSSKTQIRSSPSLVVSTHPLPVAQGLLVRSKSFFSIVGNAGNPLTCALRSTKKGQGGEASGKVSRAQRNCGNKKNGFRVLLQCFF